MHPIKVSSFYFNGKGKLLIAVSAAVEIYILVRQGNANTYMVSYMKFMRSEYSGIHCMHLLGD